MKSGFFFVVTVVLSSSFAFADFDLAKSGKKITCYGDDNYSFVLNAKRTSIKITVEGESSGPKLIKKVTTDRKTYVSYQTNMGVLRLSSQGDSFQFKGDSNKMQIDCE